MTPWNCPVKFHDLVTFVFSSFLLNSFKKIMNSYYMILEHKLVRVNSRIYVPSSDQAQLSNDSAGIQVASRRPERHAKEALTQSRRSLSPFKGAMLSKSGSLKINTHYL